ncbi:MAG: hypothetical protein PWP21_1115 [Thermosediminibacterales bacterium]|nr:hypothetical protein [Thermosediminibacterales bacterium]
MQLKNFMEILVENEIDGILENYKDICKCERCKKDIMALALNNLPPKYYVTEKGEVYNKIQALNQQFSTDVLTAILKAVKQVSKNPRH